MRIRVRHPFKYTFDNITTHTLETGEYEVPRQVDTKVAELAIQFGNAVIIPGEIPRKKMARKKAPENKVKKVKETK